MRWLAIIVVAFLVCGCKNSEKITTQAATSAEVANVEEYDTLYIDRWRTEVLNDTEVVKVHDSIYLWRVRRTEVHDTVKVTDTAKVINHVKIKGDEKSQVAEYLQWAAGMACVLLFFYLAAKK